MRMCLRGAACLCDVMRNTLQSADNDTACLDVSYNVSWSQGSTSKGKASKRLSRPQSHSIAMSMWLPENRPQSSEQTDQPITACDHTHVWLLYMHTKS